ncbi:hypothetical protein M0R45_000610 [Rubus argutus]|uniref:Uncharacterized protein n=1 Tax=Rubus argutus TaxID=59490 RepID=A0AAW1VQ76_RUBAR
MAPPAPAAAAVADGQVQGGRQQGGFGQSIGGIIRMAVIWYFASKFFSSPKKPSDPSQLSSNIFQKAEPLDMWFYISEHEKFNEFGSESAACMA